MCNSSFHMNTQRLLSGFFFVCLFFKYLFIYVFIFGCVGSSFLCEGFLQLRQAGATLHRGARASHYRGLSCYGAQAQQLWLTGPVAPRHVGSSQTRARARVPCIGRQILNHCATREAPIVGFLIGLISISLCLREQGDSRRGREMGEQLVGGAKFTD